MRRWFDPDPVPGILDRRYRPCPACGAAHGAVHGPSCPRHPEVLQARLAVALRPEGGLDALARGLAVAMSTSAGTALAAQGVTLEELADALRAVIQAAVPHTEPRALGLGDRALEELRASSNG